MPSRRMAEPMQCDMPTANLRACGREARYAYFDGSGRIVKGYCKQHQRAGGHSALLRLPMWEYRCAVDLVAAQHMGPAGKDCPGIADHLTEGKAEA